MSRARTHWVSFDPINLPRVCATLAKGSGFTIERTFAHPTDMTRTVLKLTASVGYDDLDLEVNSLSSPLRYHHHKPAGLGRGLAVEQFERIYGRRLLPPRGES